jgi:hypothetical protein
VKSAQDNTSSTKDHPQISEAEATESTCLRRRERCFDRGRGTRVTGRFPSPLLRSDDSNESSNPSHQARRQHQDDMLYVALLVPWACSMQQYGAVLEAASVQCTRESQIRDIMHSGNKPAIRTDNTWASIPAGWHVDEWRQSRLVILAGRYSSTGVTDSVTPPHRLNLNRSVVVALCPTAPTFSL